MSSNDCVQDLRITVNPPISECNQELLKLVGSGRGSLDFILGDADRRVRLLSQSINWSRTVVAWRDGHPVGYAQMRFGGHGPYEPHWDHFIKEYGWLHGPLAWLIFYIAELWNCQCSFYFYGLKVSLEERKQGIGEALVRAVMEHAISCGYDRVELDVGPNFVIAKRLYERCGFKEVGRSQLLGIARFLPFRELSFMRCDFATLNLAKNQDDGK